MDFAKQLKSQVDIVQTIQTYVKLRRNGRRYVGLCPFHSEKTPSFGVNPDLQFYKCFGCNAAGDVIKFVEEIEHLSFYEALKLLAERNGIPMPRNSQYTDEDSKLRGAVMTMHEIAAQEFQELLASPLGAEARGYLMKRGVSPEMVSHFGLGLSDRSGSHLVRALQRHSFTADQFDNSGLILKRDNGPGYFDRFRNRLMFPIHNESGKIIGFGGRALDPEEKAKYLNSPESPIYKKSNVLFNLHRAKEGVRKHDRAILVEGYMDVIGVYSSGVTEVVASCGTALTPAQVRMMKRHSNNVAVNFDPDAAGENAAQKSIQMFLEEGMRVRIVELDEDLDPDEYCLKNGPEAYAARVESAKSYFYWLADRGRARYDAKTSEGRVAIFQFLLPAIRNINDKLERASIANDVASYLGIERGLVLENFRKMAVDREERPARPVREPLQGVDRILLSLILANADAQAELLPEMRGLPALRTSSASRIYQALFALGEGGVQVDFATLHGRLEDEDRERLTEAFFSEAVAPTAEDGRACIEKLRDTSMVADRDSLKAAIRDAERRNDIGEALRLMRELSDLG